MYFFPSTWKRLIARLLDDGYIFILQLPVVVVFVVNSFQSESFKIHWAHAVYFILVRILYETISVAFFSTTLGKKQMGLTIINRNRGVEKTKIGFDQALLRSIVGQLSHIIGWSLYVTAFFKHNRTHVGDWIADTQVVSYTARDKRPQIRWIFAIGFMILSFSSSIKGTAASLNSLTWQKPYLYFQNSEFEKMIKQMNVNFDMEDSDEEDAE